MNIDTKSTKADIIDAAIELTDSQAETINRQQEQIKVLTWVAVVATTWALIF